MVEAFFSTAREKNYSKVLIIVLSPILGKTSTWRIGEKVTAKRSEFLH